MQCGVPYQLPHAVVASPPFVASVDSQITFAKQNFTQSVGMISNRMSYLRQNKNDKYIGMTLINNNNNKIPGWNSAKHFLKNNKDIYIEKGYDKTGNMFNSKNFHYCYKKYKNKIHFITADGGFDFSVNYENQESSSNWISINPYKANKNISKLYEKSLKQSKDIIIEMLRDSDNSLNSSICYFLLLLLFTIII